jgi:hypothetical protein
MTKLATNVDMVRLEDELKLIKPMLDVVLGGVLALALKCDF